MSNFKPFELIGSVDELPKLTSSGFKKEGDDCKYVFKITDAVINFAGDNSKFAENDKKKLNNYLNYLIIALPNEQAEVLKQIIDETRKENHPYTDDLEFKVKLNPKTKFEDKNKKAIKIDLRKFPCTELRDYIGAMIDLAITGESKEFDSKEGQKFSYTTLTAVQIKIKDTNSIFDCECDFL